MNRIVAGYPIGNRAVRKQGAYTKIDSIKTQLLLKLLVLGVFIVILCLVYIWSRVQVVSNGYIINDLKQEEFVLKNDNKKLQMELALLKSPERLKGFAGSRLNMTLPNQERIVQLNEP
jgi:cell division protein FtsL